MRHAMEGLDRRIRQALPGGRAARHPMQSSRLPEAAAR
jgi:hypothetical protein